MKTNNRLTNADFYKLCQGLQTFSSEIKERRLSRIEAAQILSERLNLNITNHNISGACEALDLDIFPRRTKSENTTDIIVRSVLYLFDKLGETPPDDLKNLV